MSYCLPRPVQTSNIKKKFQCIPRSIVAIFYVLNHCEFWGEPRTPSPQRVPPKKTDVAPKNSEAAPGVLRVRWMLVFIMYVACLNGVFKILNLSCSTEGKLEEVTYGFMVLCDQSII